MNVILDPTNRLFMCSPLHISIIANSGHGLYGDQVHGPKQAGKMLWEANFWSIKTFNDEPLVKPGTFPYRFTGARQPGHILKWTIFFRAQCVHWDLWEESWSNAFTIRVLEHHIKMLDMFDDVGWTP